MLFSVDKETLVAALDIVSKACEKNTMEILEGVLIDVKDGLVTLACCNTITTITSKFNTLNFNNGTVVINTKFLLDYVRSLPKGDVLLKTNDDNKSMLIKCGKSKSTIAFMNADEFPKIRDGAAKEEIAVKVVSGELKDVLNETAFCMAQDETRPMLLGINLDIKNGENDKVGTLTSTSLDGFRLATAVIPVDSTKDFSCIVPKGTIPKLEKILGNGDDNINICFDGKHIKFFNEESSLSSSIIDETFIDYKKMIPGEPNLEICLKKDELESCLRRVSPLANRNNSSLVKLLTNGNVLQLKTSNDLGCSEEEVEILSRGGKEKDKDIEIAFNIQYISDILRVIDEDEIILKLTTSLAPVVLLKKESKNFLALVLPVRLTKK